MEIWITPCRPTGGDKPDHLVTWIQCGSLVPGFNHCVGGRDNRTLVVLPAQESRNLDFSLLKYKNGQDLHLARFLIL